MAKNAENPLVGKEVWTLAITNDCGVSETTVSVHTSFRKALNAAKVEFTERNLIKDWESAERQLKECGFFHDPCIFNGDRFQIDCAKIY